VEGRVSIQGACGGRGLFLYIPFICLCLCACICWCACICACVFIPHEYKLVGPCVDVFLCILTTSREWEGVREMERERERESFRVRVRCAPCSSAAVV
jgi:hypothetical protein